jgi:DNA-binding transcriptional regulator YiaG
LKLISNRINKVIVSVHYYKISDLLFNEIVEDRKENKLTIEELAKKFNVGVNKLKNEFKERNLIIKRIR